MLSTINMVQDKEHSKYCEIEVETRGKTMDSSNQGNLGKNSESQQNQGQSKPLDSKCPVPMDLSPLVKGPETSTTQSQSQFDKILDMILETEPEKYLKLVPMDTSKNGTRQIRGWAGMNWDIFLCIYVFLTNRRDIKQVSQTSQCVYMELLMVFMGNNCAQHPVGQGSVMVNPLSRIAKDKTPDVTFDTEEQTDGK